MAEPNTQQTEKSEKAEKTEKQGKQAKAGETASEVQKATQPDEVRVNKRGGGERGDLATRQSGSALFDFDPFSMDPFSLLQNVVGMLDLGRQRTFERAALAPLEIFERGDQLVVRADLPGINKNDIRIEIANGYLLLEGERVEENRETDEGFYRSERAYGSFRRAVALPEGVDANSAKAQFKDGVLEVVMKQSRPQSRRLEIEGG